MKIVHKYVRRFIKWCSAPSDEEITVSGRSVDVRALGNAMRYPPVHDHHIISGISKERAAELLALVDDAEIDKFTGGRRKFVGDWKMVLSEISRLGFFMGKSAV